MNEERAILNTQIDDQSALRDKNRGYTDTDADLIEDFVCRLFTQNPTVTPDDAMEKSGGKRRIVCDELSGDEFA